MNAKKWLVTVGSIFAIILIITVSAVCYIDPFWHYHGPSSGLQYPLNEPRYINDGILKHFDYEGLIIGTSMCDNFSTTQVNNLWGKDTVKTTFQGATYHELSQNIQRAIGYNSKLDLVICSIDSNNLNVDYDMDTYEGIPTYLFDKNPFNDVYYLLNKDVLRETLAVVNYTRAGKTTPDFDDYERFDIYHPFSKEAVLESYSRPDKIDYGLVFSDEDRERVAKNITKNIVEVARKNPEVTFNLFIPPYSVCYWDSMNRTHQLDFVMECCKYGYSLLLEEDNIHVFGFDLMFDYTNDLNHYMDTLHYNSDMNGMILDSIYAAQNELTKDSIDSYYETIREYYLENENIINDYLISP